LGPHSPVFFLLLEITPALVLFIPRGFHTISLFYCSPLFFRSFGLSSLKRGLAPPPRGGDPVFSPPHFSRKIGVGPPPLFKKRGFHPKIAPPKRLVLNTRPGLFLGKNEKVWKKKNGPLGVLISPFPPPGQNWPPWELINEKPRDLLDEKGPAF